MALRDRFERDNHKIFMNEDHFAEKHTWNGEEFTCVPDDTEALKRKNNNVNDISWDNNALDMVLFVPEDSLPARAQPNEFVLFDDHQVRVADVIDAKGMKEIHLSLAWARGVQA